MLGHLFGSWSNRHFHGFSVSTSWMCPRLCHDTISNHLIHLVFFFLRGRAESEDMHAREMSLFDHVCRASAHRRLNPRQSRQFFCDHHCTNDVTTRQSDQRSLNNARCHKIFFVMICDIDDSTNCRTGDPT